MVSQRRLRCSKDPSSLEKCLLLIVVSIVLLKLASPSYLQKSTTMWTDMTSQASKHRFMPMVDAFFPTTTTFTLIVRVRNQRSGKVVFVMDKSCMSTHGISCIQGTRQAQNALNDLTNRRDWVGKAVANLSFFLIAKPIEVVASSPPVSSIDPLQKIIDCQETLGLLLTNWKRATVDCTFADVPRDLLEQKNKELLLEKASTFALFDKSVSIETCKTTNRIVRDYLGVTNKGPLVQIMKTLQSSKTLDLLQDPDDLDAYLAEVESFGQSLASATSLSYTAGTADLTSVNTFSKEESASMGEGGGDNSNLEQARKSVVSMKEHLDNILNLLMKEETS